MESIPTTLPLLLLSAGAQATALVRLRSPYLPGLGFYAFFVLMVVINISAWLIYRMAIYPNFVSPLRNLPSPKGAHPFFGHAASQIRFPRGEDYLKFIKDIPNDGLIRIKGVLNSDEVLITGAKGLAEVLVARSYDFPKPERSREVLRSSLGEGLVVAEGPQHKRQRKHSLPSFGFRQIKDLYPLFWAKSVKMVKCIDAEVFGSQPPTTDSNERQFGMMDVEHWLPKATLDIIGVAGLGRDFNTLENSHDRIAVLYEELTAPSDEMRLLMVMHLMLGGPLAGLICFKAARRAQKTTDGLRALCTQFVQDKRERLKDPDDKSVDVLATLMKADVFGDQELVDQLLTIIAAGHETTSSAFTWLVYLLSLHPDIQERLRSEIRTALPEGLSSLDNARNFDIGAVLESLPLLNGVCNETLRVFPTVPVTARVSKHNTTLLGQYVSAGTKFYICPWAINKDPAIWGADADEFKPERWIDPITGKPNQTGGTSSNYAFLTFLHGPRSCIGQNFAKSELRALVAAFIVAFEWSLANPSEKVRPAGMVTTKPKDGLKIKISKVKDL